VGPTTIYSPFAKLPGSFLGAPSIRFPIHLQPRDQDPATYTVTLPWAAIHPRPLGSIFLTSRPGTHAHVQNYQITVICSLSSDIVHVGYSVLICAGTWSSQLNAWPFQVYDRYWHVIIPSEYQLHLPVTPSDICL
jgi:hypothetical protein